MHQISFELKRGHLKTVAWGEAALRGRVPNMTAARFDLLYLLRQRAISYGDGALTTGILQRELWQRLDLDKSTISKMLRRLEAMGWVYRTRPTNPRDWRTKKVFVTQLGLRRIAKAMRIMFRQRLMPAYFERIVKEHRRWRIRHPVKSLCHLRETIHDVARCFGDVSLLTYDLGDRMDGWPLGFDHPGRTLHPLYQPPPPPPRSPPTRKGPRLPCRPFELSEQEELILDSLRSNPRRRRR